MSSCQGSQFKPATSDITGCGEVCRRLQNSILLFYIYVNCCYLSIRSPAVVSRSTAVVSRSTAVVSRSTAVVSRSTAVRYEIVNLELLCFVKSCFFVLGSIYCTYSQVRVK